MKILLIATNREKSPFPVAPVGALMVAAAARRAGHEVRVLDLAFSGNPARAAVRAVREYTPDLVGFSVRNLDNCLYVRPRSYADETRRIVEAARAATSVPFVVGGCGFSVEPEGWMRRLPVDYGVVGEGEAAFVALIQSIDSGQGARGLSGVIGKAPLKAGDAPSIRPLFADSFGAPEHALCDYRPHLRRGGFVSVQSKRGCPYECVYCVYPNIEGRRYRLREPEAVVEEIAAVAARGARDFFFTDSVFNSPRAHALAICRGLAKRGLAIRWMAYCNPEGFDLELAKAMRESGCVGVEFGLDAATQKMLGNMGKSFSQEDIRRALQAVRDAVLPSAVHLLFGGPDETLDDLVETRSFLDGCATPNAVFASLGIRVYSGTAMERIARAEGAVKEGDDLFEPRYYVSKGWGANPQARLDHVARSRPEWTTATDWLRSSMGLIQGLINRMGMKPQWKNIANYGRRMRKQTKDEESGE